ncbi:aldo/keto reductase [Chitinophaga sp.]|uniref:aldo/keto reductase n=1 Tax=Chitinophaga sp. TaxID=1869181 RepID=UPI0031D28F26
MVKQVKLGSQGLAVPTIGLGCMGMTTFSGMEIYGQANEQESIATIHRSLELGGNFLDTADVYGPFKNEQLIAKAIQGKREQYIIASKFGFTFNEEDKYTGAINGRKEYVKLAAERSLKNLGTDYIDLYYLHRLDPETPVEETVGAMAELVKEGKVRYIGLSEVGTATIRKAHAVHPLTAVQSEYNLFEREVEELGILATLQELGIGFVAYSPLGRGFIGMDFKHPEEIPASDFRRYLPRFQGQQFYQNLALLEAIKNMAAEKQVSASQLAIAWIIAKGHLPIPGTKRVPYLEQNIAATHIALTTDDINRLEKIIPIDAPTGARMNEEGMKQVNL